MNLISKKLLTVNYVLDFFKNNSKRFLQGGFSDGKGSYCVRGCVNYKAPEVLDGYVADQQSIYEELKTTIIQDFPDIYRQSERSNIEPVSFLNDNYGYNYVIQLLEKTKKRLVETE